MQNLINTPSNITLNWPPPSELKHPLFKSTEGRVYAERLGGRAEVTTNEAGRAARPDSEDRTFAAAEVEERGVTAHALSFLPLREKIREGIHSVAELQAMTLAEIEELKKLKAAEDGARGFQNPETTVGSESQDKADEGLFGGKGFSDMRHILDNIEEEREYRKEHAFTQQRPKTPHRVAPGHSALHSPDKVCSTLPTSLSTVEKREQYSPPSGIRTPATGTAPTTQNKMVTISRVLVTAKKVVDFATPERFQEDTAKEDVKIEPPPSPCGGMRYCEKNHRHQLRMSGPVSTPPWISENRMTPATEYPGNDSTFHLRVHDVSPARAGGLSLEPNSRSLMTPRRYLSVRAVTPSPAPFGGQQPRMSGRTPGKIPTRPVPVCLSSGEEPGVEYLQEESSAAQSSTAPEPSKERAAVKKETGISSRLFAPTAASRARSRQGPDVSAHANALSSRPAANNPKPQGTGKGSISTVKPRNSRQPQPKSQTEVNKSATAAAKVEVKKPVTTIPKIVKTAPPKPTPKKSSVARTHGDVRQLSPTKGRTPHKPHYLTINTQRTSVFDRLSAPTAASRARCRQDPEVSASEINRARSRAEPVRPKSRARLAAPTAASLGHKTPLRTSSARNRTPPLYAPIPLSPKNQTEDWEQRGYAAYEVVRLLSKYCSDQEARMLRHDIDKVFLDIRKGVIEVRGDAFLKKKQRLEQSFRHIQTLLGNMVHLVKGREEGEIVESLVKRVGASKY
jgi:hypothetical protein